MDGPNLYAYVRQNPWTKFDPEGLAEEVIAQVYGLVKHESKRIYVGSVYSEKRMLAGGTPVRHDDPLHEARSLLDENGTIREYDDVVVDDSWRGTAKAAGRTEQSARHVMAETQERLKLQEMMEKYPDYEVMNKIKRDEEGTVVSLGQGLIKEETAAQVTETYGPKMAGRAKTQISIEGKWIDPDKFHLKPGQAVAYGSAIALAFMVAGEVTGANQAAVNNVRENLQWYFRTPNEMTAAGLGYSLGAATNAPDTLAAMIQQSFAKHATEVSK